MGFSRQEHWSGLPCPPPEDLPNSGMEPRFPPWQADCTIWATREASNVNVSRVRLCDPIDCSLPDSSVWDFPGNSTGVGCHFLFQGIFPTQGLNPGLPHCRQTLYRLSHQGSPNPHARGGWGVRGGGIGDCVSTCICLIQFLGRKIVMASF